MLVRLLTVPFAVLALGASPAAAEDDYGYSELREAIQDRHVQSATLQPAKGEAEIVLRGGRRVTVEYPPTDLDLAEDLASAGAKVEVENRAAGGMPAGMIVV